MLLYLVNELNRKLNYKKTFVEKKSKSIIVGDIIKIH